MKKLKSVLMAGVMAGMLMTSGAGMASGNSGAWIGAGVSAVGTIYSFLMTFFNGGTVVIMGWGTVVNVDPAQLAAEAGVLYQMYNVKDEWEPEPADEYQKAAENNGGTGGGAGAGGVSLDMTAQKLSFVVASLKNVGIEAIGVGPSLGEIANDETRTKIFTELSFVQPKGSAKSTKTKESEIPGAGDCSASYSVCLKEMKSTEEEEVIARQKQNEQNFGTAGVAHAELGLMSVQQAMANDGNGAVGKAGAQSSAKTDFTASKVSTVQNLASAVGTGKNTVAAMKIVSLMNLELAQRLNQGNMMQGSTLTIEASRALTQTADITD